MPNGRTLLRWGVRIALAAVAVLAVCGLGAAAFLATQSGRDTVARIAEEALSDDQTTVRIARVTGNLAATFHVGEISVADASGATILIDDARLSWHPLALVGGTLDIATLDIHRISVSGKGGTEAAAAPPATSALPPFAIRIARLNVGEIALDATLLGEPQRLSLSGSLSAEAAPLALAVKARLRRIDAAPGHADIDIAYTGRPARFSARVDIEEPAGGPVARLAGLPAATPLSIQLHGAGPPDGWHGRLVARAGPLAAVTSDLAVAVGEEGASLSLDGEASVAGLAPATVRPLLAKPVRLHAAIDVASAGRVTVRDFTATTDSLSLKGTGKYDPARNAIAATASAESSGSLTLPGIAPGMTIDGARVDADLTGTVARPVVALRLKAVRLSVPAATATGLAGQLRLAAGPDRALAISGSVRADSVDTGDALPPGLLGKALEMKLDGTLRSDGMVPRMDIGIASGALSAEISVAMHQADRLEGRYSLHHDDVAAFAAGLGLPLRGGVDAKGNFESDLSRGVAQLDLSGSLDRASLAEPWLAALLDRHASFAGRLAWQGNDTLRIGAFELASGTVRARASGTVRPAAGVVEATYTASVADLGRLSGMADAALAGRLDASGTVKGALASPRMTARIAAHGLTVEGVALGNVGAGVAAQPTAAGVRAAVRLGGSMGGRQIDGDVDVVVDGDTVRLPRMRLAVGRNSLSGGLTIDTAHGHLLGQATATLPHLEDLPAVAALPAAVTGSGTVKLRLHADGVQLLDIDAKTDGLALGAGTGKAVSVGSMTATLAVRDPFAAFSVDGKVRLSDIRAEGATLQKVALTARGSRRSLTWTVSADGNWHVPVTVAASGSVRLAGDDMSVRVERLDGKVAAQTVRLRKPASLHWSSRAVRAGPVELAVSDGTLSLTAEGSADRLDVTGEVKDLPLALAALADPRLDLAGTLSGTARLSGTAPLPAIDVDLTATGIRSRNLSNDASVALSVTASLHQQASGTRLKLTMHGPDEMSAEAALETGPLVGLGPPRLLPPAGQKLSGRVNGKARLAVIDRILALGEDRLAGRLDAALTIGGTLEKPVVNGEAHLSDGAYEGAATGVVVRDAAARIAFNGTTARLVSLTATDGNSGRLSGSGTFDFSGGGTPADRLTVKLDHFTALRRTEAEIVATGAVTLNGPLDTPSVAGKLTVEKAELRIPDRLPEDVVDLQVQEINLPKGAEAASSRKKEPSVSRSLPLALDLAIDFPGRTFVRGRGLDSEWKGALAIKGTSASPKITGKLDVVRGTFAFAGKSFRLKSGSVTLTGEEPVEPEIDATAEAQLKTIVARVRISGRMSKPTLAVTSDPPLPQEEVLARILFGRTTGQLSAIQAAQLAQTAATLSGSGAGGANIVDRVRQALGVDVLNVESGEAGGTGKGASLKAGKYLTDNVFLSVTQGTEPGSQKVGVEVEVLPNLSVESDISGTASSNVGVNWKFDY